MKNIYVVLLLCCVSTVHADMLSDAILATDIEKVRVLQH